MADENGDIDMDAPIGGGGGYIDDDIDIDDDDDELVPLGARSTPSAPADIVPLRKPRSSKPAPRKEEASASARAIAAERAPRETDLLLRPGSKDSREIILARFLGESPDLRSASRVRAYRYREGTRNSRARGLKEHRRQESYYKSYQGQRRLERYKFTGHKQVYDRARKSWTAEITPPGVPPAPIPPPPAKGEQPEYPAGADVYTGAFDGAHTGAHYALFVMDSSGRHVDVVPVSDTAWYSFRAVISAGGSAQSAEEAAARMNANAKRGDKLISKLQNKYEDAQIKREVGMGGRSHETKMGIASVGLRRKVNAKREAELAQEKGEGLDFDQEFDNDDVEQVDREEAKEERERKRPQRDPKKDAAALKKFLSDQQYDPQAQSESENDEKSRSPSPSADLPPRPASPSRPTLPRQGSPPPATAVRNSGSRAPSRAGTPQLMDEVRHLLPPKGVMPTAQHIQAVLKALTVDRGEAKVKLRDFLGYFERNTALQKTNLGRLLRSHGVVSEEVPGSKNYFISPLE